MLQARNRRRGYSSKKECDETALQIMCYLIVIYYRRAIHTKGLLVHLFTRSIYPVYIWYKLLEYTCTL